MIEEFSFGNFWSFKDIQTLNLTAANIKSKNLKIDIDNLIPVNDKVSLLKSKAIYGANASGKSNVIKALNTFIEIIKNSASNDKVLGEIIPFLLAKDSEKEPTFFQIIFRINNIRYRYGFEATDKVILSEWLFSTPNIREQALFIREGKKIIELNETHFSEGAKLKTLFDNEEGDNELFRENSLFLTSVASFGFGKKSKEIIDELYGILVDDADYRIFEGEKGAFYLTGILKDKKIKTFINKFLNFADTGIKDIELVSFANSNKKDNLLFSVRKGLNGERDKLFNFDKQESEGTKKMLRLSIIAYACLTLEKILFIDEFDAKFHPLLTKKIVELFNSTENKNAQLVFITHDTNLLSADLLRRDQIDFVEKDKFGASHLYSLVQFKGIRNNASFEKDYIQGKYGAIPFLGDFKQLFNFNEPADAETN